MQKDRPSPRRQRLLGALAAAALVLPSLLAASDPLPPAFAPAPGRLAHWTFNQPDLASPDGRAPRVARGLRTVPGLDGTAVLFGRTNETLLLEFPAVEPDGRVNLTFPQGSIRFLYRPPWSSRLPGAGPQFGWGRGPAQWARLFALQATRGEQSFPLLTLSIDPDGTNLVLQARHRDGTFQTNLQATLRWIFPQPGIFPNAIPAWHEIGLSWSPTGTELTVDGLLLQDWSNRRITGPGVGSLDAPESRLTFTLGSDAAGEGPLQGQYDEVETYDRMLTPLDLYAIRESAVLNAAVSPAPPAVSLRWFGLSADPVPIRRRSLESTQWVTLTNLQGSFSFRDQSPDLQLGETYEYEVGRRRAVVSLHGRPVEQRGRVLVLTEESLLRPLANELEQLRANLVGDGWIVIRHPAPRHDDNAWQKQAINPQYLADVQRVKSLIQSEYRAAPAETRAVLLIGHVTIPYSGVAYEDGHWDMNGAWPADSYYGDVDGEWSDHVANTANNLPNPVRRNVPGDGKFDPATFQQYLTTPDGAHGVELAVGRLDFVRLPAFQGQTEVELLRQYFRKNHRYRHKQIAFDQTATVGAFFSNPFNPVGRAIHLNGLLAGSRLESLAGIAHGDAFASPRASRWAVQGGYGAVDTIHNNRRDAAAQGIEVVMSSTLATNRHEPRAAFYLLKASYLGEWNFHRDNLLRALLATPNYGLASCWTMDSLWHFESLAAGDTLGSGFVRTARGAASTRATFLLGDPTLRAIITAPPTRAAGQREGADVHLRWNASPDASLGYLVFRSPGGNDFRQVRLTETPALTASFTDANAPRGRTLYHICAAQEVVTGTGTFTNLSQAAFVIVDRVP